MEKLTLAQIADNVHYVIIEGGAERRRYPMATCAPTLFKGRGISRPDSVDGRYVVDELYDGRRFAADVT